MQSSLGMSKETLTSILMVGPKTNWSAMEKLNT